MQTWDSFYIYYSQLKYCRKLIKPPEQKKINKIIVLHQYSVDYRNSKMKIQNIFWVPFQCHNILIVFRILIIVIGEAFGISSSFFLLNILIFNLFLFSVNGVTLTKQKYCAYSRYKFKRIFVADNDHCNKFWK